MADHEADLKVSICKPARVPGRRETRTARTRFPCDESSNRDEWFVGVAFVKGPAEELTIGLTESTQSNHALLPTLSLVVTRH